MLSVSKKEEFSMLYHALAVDYDGTLATDGIVDEATIETLRRLRESGRKLILVTGRIIEQLLQVFPQIGLCNLVVADNGAVLFDPQTEEITPLADPPPPEFAEALARRGVPHIETGHVVVATWEPYETTVLQTIRDLGLELQIIFNKGAVMVLPTGVNKATGLRAALKKIGLSQHNTVGIGDAENDEAFLKLCDASAAVDNALDVVKRQVDLVMRGARGAGVVELVEQVLADDLIKLRRRPDRGVVMGTDLAGNDFHIPVYGTRVLVTGGPAGGKSKFAVAMLEQLTDKCYQTCVVDPEGDYQGMKDPVVLGTLQQAPPVEEVIEVLDDPEKSCVMSLFGARRDEQPEIFARLLRALMEYRSRTGRPHWYIIDEAHYPLPAKWQPVEELNLDELRSVMYITAFPDQLPARVLRSVDLVVAIGDDPVQNLAQYCESIAIPTPEVSPPADRREHRALAWWRDSGPPVWFRRIMPRAEHQRHRHGYLDGDMDPEHRFYFRGEKGELNLAAQNLRMFMQLGEGVDDETWLHHLRQGDYAHWFREIIKDEQLAETAERLAHNGQIDPSGSRRQLFDLIRRKYEKEA
jgi:hydroxymethylpyrimidine pyrophosphatase-like HAD family hydrolase